MMQCAEYFKDENKVHVKLLLLCVISSFHREVCENGAPLGYCAATVALIPYHCSLCNSPDERSSENFPVLTLAACQKTCGVEG
jgi:hypothetical protein